MLICRVKKWNNWSFLSKRRELSTEQACRACCWEESSARRMNFLNRWVLKGCVQRWPLSLTHTFTVFLSSPALPADISIPGRSKERESFFKDTPLTSDSCSHLSLLFFRAKIFTLEKVWLCYFKKCVKKKKKKKRRRKKMQGRCVFLCVSELAFPLKTLHDKSPFSPHSSLTTTQQVPRMKYLAEDKVFHVLLWTQLLPGPFA